MKFSTPLLALALASTTFGSAIPQKRAMEEFNIQDDINIQVPTMTNTCATELFEQNKECILELNSISNLEQKCAAYKTDKCKNFYTDVISNLTNCGAIDEGHVTSVNMAMDSTKKYLDVLCANDENNTLCPISAALAGDIDGAKYNQAINDSCKSKSCTDAGVTFLELNLGTSGQTKYNETKFDKPFDFKEATEKGDTDYYALAYLKSDYCATQHSGATTLSSSILVTLIALCFTLLF